MSLLMLDSAPVIKNAGVHENYFYVEIAILIGVILYQIYHSVKLYFKIINLRELFNFDLEVVFGEIEKDKLIYVDDDSSNYISWNEDRKVNEPVKEGYMRIPLLKTEGDDDVLIRIKKTINKYLLNNYGATVNYGIIKDIVDREVEVRDEEISQSITTPLYFGLAATMIGIICGLLAMPEIKNDTNIDTINYLIRGVKWAMWASLIGLGLTTWLSSFTYRDAKSIVLDGKNRQLSYLQAKLLPELIKAEDTGVTGLKASLDRFVRVATKISDNVLIAANQTGENLTLQQELIEKFEKTGIQKISKVNLELFDKLEKNMEAFVRFASYVESMEKISVNLKEFGYRTSDISKLIDSINSNLSDSKEIYRFLSEHFKKIESAGDAAMKAVGLAEISFENAIDTLKIRVNEMTESLNKLIVIKEIKLEDVVNQSDKHMREITERYIKEFTEAYANSLPKFEHLTNLKLLPEIKNDFLSRTDELKSQNQERVKAFSENMTVLNESLKEMQNNNISIIEAVGTVESRIKSNNQNILEKLTSFEGKLNHKSDSSKEVISRIDSIGKKNKRSFLAIFSRRKKAN